MCFINSYRLPLPFYLLLNHFTAVEGVSLAGLLLKDYYEAICSTSLTKKQQRLTSSCHLSVLLKHLIHQLTVSAAEAAAPAAAYAASLVVWRRKHAVNFIRKTVILCTVCRSKLFHRHSKQYILNSDQKTSHHTLNMWLYHLVNIAEFKRLT